MVAVGSLVLIFISVYGLGFEFNKKFFFKEFWTENPLNRLQGLSFSAYLEAKKMYADWKPTLLYTKTNWLGIISVFNIVVSSVGFFLFKDKK